ncbi:MAG TPA: MOSC domain-containing protein [Pyrinomonadaceae bacterium]|jgi:MOSC domain-containing protein YiiM
MKIVSVNVGRPRLVVWKGRTVSTGIFKEPVEGRIAVRTLNLEGDRQADLAVHGGVTKAVYAYPAEHYTFWANELSGTELRWGTFGENLTVEGLSESLVHIGDYFRVGSAELMVTEPRMPCYKLGIKFGRDDIVERFRLSGLSGFYLSVVTEGELGTGDSIHLIKRDESASTVADIVRLYVRDRDDNEGIRRALATPALPDKWKARFREQLDRAGASSNT